MNCDLSGNRDGGIADLFQTRPVAGPPNDALNRKIGNQRGRRSRGTARGRYQLSAGTVNARAIIRDMRNGRTVKMERENENKQQNRHADGVAKMIGCIRC